MSQPILVVDDDPGLRQMMQWALEDEGYRVEAAADAEQAVAHMRDAVPRLVVLDMTLPGRDGTAVAEALRALDPKVPIVLVTGDGNAQSKAERVGARAFLRKPFRMDDLVANVRGAIATPP